MVTAKEVPPGGAGEIKATFKSKGYNGSVKKTFTVKSNDPDNSQVRLRLVGKVISEVNVTPRYINFGTVNKNQQPEPKELEITFREGNKIKLLSVDTESDAIVLTNTTIGRMTLFFSMTASITSGTPWPRASRARKYIIGPTIRPPMTGIIIRMGIETEKRLSGLMSAVRQKTCWIKPMICLKKSAPKPASTPTNAAIIVVSVEGLTPSFSRG